MAETRRSRILAGMSGTPQANLSDESSRIDAGADDEPRVPVAEYASEREAWEHGLVPLAMGVPYWLESDGGRHRLCVEPAVAEVVGVELGRADHGSGARTAERIRRTNTSVVRRGAWVAALVWTLVELWAYHAQGRWDGTTEAFAMDARQVFAEGEVWRGFTALFLHADAGHLVSNLGGGVFLFALVFSFWRPVRGALLLAGASTLANLVVGAVHYPAEYRSLGASTAVFAALGMLTGRAVWAALAGREAAGWLEARRARKAAWVSFAAGVTLLMLFGAGAEAGRVDVPAHAAGFVVGALVGALFAGLNRARRRRAA